ncbi:MAG: metal-dependent transcriptional regulator [Flavobacteriales bacterium]
MIHSLSEENYLKTICHLEDKESKVSPAMLAKRLKISAASVIEMIKKLVEKQWVLYEKKRGIRLTEKGQNMALEIIRSHRLWEFFLLEKLLYTWDEVHDIAEQLEHVKASDLLKRLEHYLEYPQYDPHGDPIPQADGFMRPGDRIPLSEAQLESIGRVVAVKDSSSDFLQYLQKLSIEIGTEIQLVDKVPFNGSVIIRIGKDHPVNISREFAENLLIKEQ